MAEPDILLTAKLDISDIDPAIAKLKASFESLSKQSLAFGNMNRSIRTLTDNLNAAAAAMERTAKASNIVFGTSSISKISAQTAAVKGLASATQAVAKAQEEVSVSRLKVNSAVTYQIDAALKQARQAEAVMIAELQRPFREASLNGVRVGPARKGIDSYSSLSTNSSFERAREQMRKETMAQNDAIGRYQKEQKAASERSFKSMGPTYSTGMSLGSTAEWKKELRDFEQSETGIKTSFSNLTHTMTIPTDSFKEVETRLKVMPTFMDKLGASSSYMLNHWIMLGLVIGGAEASIEAMSHSLKEASELQVQDVLLNANKRSASSLGIKTDNATSEMFNNAAIQLAKKWGDEINDVSQNTQLWYKRTGDLNAALALTDQSLEYQRATGTELEDTYRTITGLAAQAAEMPLVAGGKTGITLADTPKILHMITSAALAMGAGLHTAGRSGNELYNSMQEASGQIQSGLDKDISVFGTLNLSVEQTIAYTAALIQAYGNTGAAAGEASDKFQRLIGGMEKLSIPSEVASLAKQGIPVQSLQKAMTPGPGVDELKNLTDWYFKLGDAQKKAFAYDIGGTRNAAAFQDVLTQVENAYPTILKSTKDMTAEDKLAADMQETFRAKSERLAASLEALGIVVGTEFLPFLTGAVDFMRDSGIPVLTEFNQSALTLASGGLTAVGAALLGLGRFVPIIAEITAGIALIQGVNSALHTNKSLTEFYSGELAANHQRANVGSIPGISGVLSPAQIAKLNAARQETLKHAAINDPAIIKQLSGVATYDPKNPNAINGWVPKPEAGATTTTGAQDYVKAAERAYDEISKHVAKGKSLKPDITSLVASPAATGRSSATSDFSTALENLIAKNKVYNDTLSQKIKWDKEDISLVESKKDSYRSQSQYTDELATATHKTEMDMHTQAQSLRSDLPDLTKLANRAKAGIAGSAPGTTAHNQWQKGLDDVLERTLAVNDATQDLSRSYQAIDAHLENIKTAMELKTWTDWAKNQGINDQRDRLDAMEDANKQFNSSSSSASGLASGGLDLAIAGVKYGGRGKASDKIEALVAELEYRKKLVDLARQYKEQINAANDVSKTPEIDAWYQQQLAIAGVNEQLTEYEAKLKNIESQPWFQGLKAALDDLAKTTSTDITNAVMGFTSESNVLARIRSQIALTQQLKSVTDLYYSGMTAHTAQQAANQALTNAQLQEQITLENANAAAVQYKQQHPSILSQLGSNFLNTTLSSMFTGLAGGALGGLANSLIGGVGTSAGATTATPSVMTAAVAAAIKQTAGGIAGANGGSSGGLAGLLGKGGSSILGALAPAVLGIGAGQSAGGGVGGGLLGAAGGVLTAGALASAGAFSGLGLAGLSGAGMLGGIGGLAALSGPLGIGLLVGAALLGGGAGGLHFGGPTMTSAANPDVTEPSALNQEFANIAGEYATPNAPRVGEDPTMSQALGGLNEEQYLDQFIKAHPGGSGLSDSGLALWNQVNTMTAGGTATAISGPNYSNMALTNASGQAIGQYQNWQTLTSAVDQATQNLYQFNSALNTATSTAMVIINQYGGSSGFFPYAGATPGYAAPNNPPGGTSPLNPNGLASANPGAVTGVYGAATTPGSYGGGSRTAPGIVGVTLNVDGRQLARVTQAYQVQANNAGYALIG